MTTTWDIEHDDGSGRPSTEVYGFATGWGPHPVGGWGGMLYTACAINEHGRWMAGAVSQTPEGARKILALMVPHKARELLDGKPYRYRWTSDGLGDERVNAAVRKALERMP